MIYLLYWYTNKRNKIVENGYSKIKKKNTGNKVMTKSLMLLSMLIIAGGLLLFSFNLNVVMGIPLGVTEKGGDSLYGRSIGLVEDETGQPLWIISGTWKSNLSSNQTQSEDNSTVFNANFEMIKTDGTSKHTHTLTNFVLAETANQNNATIFNGTGTISMPNASITEVPISIQVMNKELGIIFIDPIKVDNHFGTNPIYGIPLEDGKQHKKKY